MRKEEGEIEGRAARLTKIFLNFKKEGQKQGYNFHE